MTFRSRTFLVTPRGVELRLYPAQRLVKVSDLGALSNEALHEFEAVTGGYIQPEEITLSANRAGMHFAYWAPATLVPVMEGLAVLRPVAGWKEARQ